MLSFLKDEENIEVMISCVLDPYKYLVCKEVKNIFSLNYTLNKIK